MSNILLQKSHILNMKKISKPTSIQEKPTFTNFQIIYSEFSRYQKNLPHFRIDNATYFVTFRLGDSIPFSIVQKWTKKKRNWLIAFGIDPELAQKNPDKYNKLYESIPAAERDAFELTQQRQVHIELDKCHGCCILKSYHEQVASAIEFFHQERGWVGDYVVMPNHVHLLLQPFPGVILEEWLYTIKRFSSNQILGKISDKNLITKN